MHLQRPPVPALRPFVELLWATEDVAPVHFAQPKREHVLPTGSMHLVFRLSDAPLWLLDPVGGPRAQAIGAAMVGGTRSRYYVREMTAPSCSVGVMLRPGASELLFGVAADELAETHTPLDDLWGHAARAAHERLCDARSAAERLMHVESMLLERLPRVHGMHPAVAAMIGRMHALPSIAAAVEQSGLSHRHFGALFRRAVGLAPKTYARVLRFQSVLRVARNDTAPAWAAIAIEAGYSDQAHFNRDFVEFAGVTPTAYRRVASVEANHVPLVERIGRA
jgi:AraC-like DNA-binding protein